MSTRAYRAVRARYAALTRSRSADDPELVVALRAMRQRAVIDQVSRALERSALLTDDSRSRIVGLVVDSLDGVE